MNDFNEQNNSFNANGWEGYIPDSYKPTPKQQNKKPVWAAVTSFVLSLVSFCIGCCCNCSIVMVILSIIFGIISLANGWRGKGLAISGIIISAVTLVFSIASIVLMNTTFKDAQEYYTELLTNPQKYIDEVVDLAEEARSNMRKRADRRKFLKNTAARNMTISGKPWDLKILKNSILFSWTVL